MSRTAMTDMKDRREFEVGKILRRLVGALAAMGLIVAVGLAFWPMPPSTTLVDPAGAVQVPLKTRDVKKALAARRPVSIEFSEAELNGYLAARARSRKLKMLGINLKPGAFELEAWMTWHAPLTNVTWLKQVQFPMSLSLTGVFDQGSLVVKRAHLGHLPLIGPGTGPVQAYFATVFNDVVAEKTVTDALTQVTIDDTKAELKLGK